MPKKTKREKVIAEYRRKLSTIRETDSPSLYVYQAKTSAPSLVTSNVGPMDHAIRGDLVKTLILAAVAIGGEIILSIIIK